MSGARRVLEIGTLAGYLVAVGSQGVTPGAYWLSFGSFAHPVDVYISLIKSFLFGTAIAIIGFLIPYTSPELLDASAENVAVAPFTLVFKLAGIDAAASIMNAVILIAILSAGNASLFAATRALYGLGVEGNAPKIFAKVTKAGVPIAATAATTVIGCLCFLAGPKGDGAAYTVLVAASSVAGFVTWIGIAWAHYRFRRAWNAPQSETELISR